MMKKRRIVLRCREKGPGELIRDKTVMKNTPPIYRGEVNDEPPNQVSSLCNGSVRPAPCGPHGSGRPGPMTPERLSLRPQPSTVCSCVCKSYIYKSIIEIICGIVNCFLDDMHRRKKYPLPPPKGREAKGNLAFFPGFGQARRGKQNRGKSRCAGIRAEICQSLHKSRRQSTTPGGRNPRRPGPESASGAHPWKNRGNASDQRRGIRPGAKTAFFEPSRRFGPDPPAGGPCPASRVSPADSCDGDRLVPAWRSPGGSRAFQNGTRTNPRHPHARVSPVGHHGIIMCIMQETILEAPSASYSTSGTRYPSPARRQILPVESTLHPPRS